jgi:hypothetical protein
MGGGIDKSFVENRNNKNLELDEKALEHIMEGSYEDINPERNNGTNKKLKSGGHSEETFKQLKTHNIGYTITKTYPNGVRIGNVENHVKTIKRFYSGQTWFPKNWTKTDIIKAINHVASLPENQNAKDGETMWGIWQGVKLGVKKRAGRIVTAFPCMEQSEWEN